MSRKKKSRKTGLIGVRKSPDFKRVEKEKRIKKVLGKPAGSRYSQPVSDKQPAKVKSNNDPRLGSKKPVDLFGKPDLSENTKVKTRFFTPEQELDHIENDQKLSDLLAKLDAGKMLDAASQHYVDQKLKRHQQLCDMLGIKDVEDLDEVSENDDDILATYEKININKLKDF